MTTAGSSATRSRASLAELRFAQETALGAGRILMRHFGRLGAAGIRSKLDQRHNLVTRADTEAEAFIVERIGKRFPRHAVLTEETGAAGAAGASERWIVDPLDGTINFVHEFPLFAVSIGLERDGRLECGVIHAPVLGETFRAARGRGAFLGAKRIRVSGTRDLRDTLMATGFPYDRETSRWDNRDNFARLIYAGRGLRRAGSAALDLAYVAAGRFDAFWELRLAPVDVAAGALLVLEAGGRVSDFRGGTDWLSSGHVVASNGIIHEALRKRLRLPEAARERRGPRERLRLKRY